MKLLHTKNMVKWFPLIDRIERVCEGCIVGKQHRKNFPVEKSYRACTPLEIVHSDICGPMQTSSIGHCNYFLTFIVTTQEKHGYIFWNINLMHLFVYINSRNWWRTRVVTTSKSQGQIEVVNMIQMNLIFFSKPMAYIRNSRRDIHLSRMVSRRGIT